MNKKLTALVLCSVLFFNSTTVVFASTVNKTNTNNIGISNRVTNEVNKISSKVLTIEQEKMVEEYNQQILSLIHSNVLKQTNIHNSYVPTRGAGTVIKTLCKKYGKRYITHELPKYIYTKLPGIVAERVTEVEFVTFWNTYVLLGSLDTVRDSVSNWLISKGVWKWAAKSAGAIVQGAIWLVV
ncbi:hypothetical protein [Clostridium sp. K25]|uniref:hypothetical protein n=1 Tax=Clostridium sp. K25 TaxID=1443109 RepID=UPI0004D60C24|nr:hypothetical protein [Clostridium sp. K25]KEI06339.1 hypothetical protein Z957_p0116 [Clostridium sp. K25]